MTHLGMTAGTRTRPADFTTAPLPGLIAARAAADGEATALLHKRHGIWHRKTWRALNSEVAALAAAMSMHGVAAGMSVLVVGANSPRLMMAWLAGLRLGAIPALAAQPGAGVPVAQVAAVTQPHIAFVAGEYEVTALRAAPPLLVVHDDANGLRGTKPDWLVDWDSFAAKGTTFLQPITPNDSTTLIFPADATGPSPVRLTQAALIEAVAGLDAIGATDRLFAALPFGWGEPLLLGPVLALVSGATLGFAESDATLLADLREFGPTLLSGPSALYGHLCRIAEADAAAASWPWRDLLQSGLFRARPLLAARAFAAPAMRDRLGLARVTNTLLHGAALPPPVAAFWQALGLAPRPFAS